MDRLAALGLWKDVLSAGVRAEGPDLSARQTAILLRIYLDHGPHTVRGIAAGLRLGKPAVSRALDALSGLQLVMRKKDEADLRNVLIERTPRGMAYIAEFADRIMGCAAAYEAPKTPDGPSHSASQRDAA